MDNQSSPNNSLFPQLESILNVYLVQKVPYTLPEGAKRFIVNVGPWISLILLLLTLPIILAAFGLAAVFTPIAYTSSAWGVMTTVGLVLALIELGLYGLALPGLFKKSKVGWNFIFYGVLISAVDAVIRLNILNLVVGTLISLYILFQVRSYYK